jgi:hypothetical protein
MREEVTHDIPQLSEEENIILTNKAPRPDEFPAELVGH